MIYKDRINLVDYFYENYLKQESSCILFFNQNKEDMNAIRHKVKGQLCYMFVITCWQNNALC